MELPRLSSPRPSPFFNKENLNALPDTGDLMMQDENKDNGRFTRNVIDNDDNEGSEEAVDDYNNWILQNVG